MSKLPHVTAVVSKECDVASLHQGVDYIIIGCDGEFFRIIDETGDPVLFPKSYFLYLNEEELPAEWITRDYGEGCYDKCPKEFSSDYFFEDFFDEKPEAIEIFKRYIQKHGIKMGRRLLKGAGDGCVSDGVTSQHSTLTTNPPPRGAAGSGGSEAQGQSYEMMFSDVSSPTNPPPRGAAGSGGSESSNP